MLILFLLLLELSSVLYWFYRHWQCWFWNTIEIQQVCATCIKMIPKKYFHLFSSNWHDLEGLLRIVSRQEWRAKPPRNELELLKLPVPKVIIAHTSNRYLYNTGMLIRPLFILLFKLCCFVFQSLFVILLTGRVCASGKNLSNISYGITISHTIF